LSPALTRVSPNKLRFRFLRLLYRVWRALPISWIRIIDIDLQEI
jgi:hypothetical protein